MGKSKSEQEYFDEAFRTIEKDLAGKSAKDLMNEHYEDRFVDSDFKEFQRYYFRHLGNIERFEEFVKHYSLRDVKGKKELEYFNKKKEEILKLVKEKPTKEETLSKLYKLFCTPQKEHGSFFTKVVHAYHNDEYTQLDIPMRKHFRLSLSHLSRDRQKYFIAMRVISKAFKKWADENRGTMDEMKKHLLAATPKEFGATENNITDIKVMNVIYWSIANPPKINPK